MSHLATIASIQVGQPTAYVHVGAVDGKDRSWTTAFFKTPVAGRVHVSRMGILGDEQADRENHGGIDKAVLAYAADHYDHWKQQLGRGDMCLGGFGENLSVWGISEISVCIGDQWQAGDVVFEVTQPRQPCWKMSRRWQIPDLAAQVIHCGASGWYLRVIAEGEISAGVELRLCRRPHPQWTVARANRLMHHDKQNLAAAAELAALPELSAAWKQTLQDRLARHAL